MKIDSIVRYRFMTFAALAATLIGCATFGVPAADTFGKQVIYARAVAESASRSIETLLTGGRISPDQARATHDEVKRAAAAIDFAQELHRVDPQAADSRLRAAISALTILKEELEAKERERQQPTAANPIAPRLHLENAGDRHTISTRSG